MFTGKNWKQEETFYAALASVKHLKLTLPSIAQLARTQNHSVTFVHNVILAVKKLKNM